MPKAFDMKTIASIKKIAPDAVWITLDGEMFAQPGQFVMVWLPTISERPFSIASNDPFGLLVMDVGPFSHALHELKAGDPLWIKGPLGHGFSIEGDSLLLVGGGYGAAPLLSLAMTAKAQRKQVNVCLGAQSQAGLLLFDEFINLGCRVACTTEDGSRGKKGLVPIIVEQTMNESRIDTLYACGPVGMLSALGKICKTHSINYQLSWEALMRCGMGLCGSCEVSQSLDPSLPVGWLACYDGPVFIQRWDD